MLAGIKDLTTAIAAITLLAYSTGQQERLWKQITALRREVLREVRQDWDCPSIFHKVACRNLVLESR